MIVQNKVIVMKMLRSGWTWGTSDVQQTDFADGLSMRLQEQVNN